MLHLDILPGVKVVSEGSNWALPEGRTYYYHYPPIKTFALPSTLKRPEPQRVLLKC